VKNGFLIQMQMQQQQQQQAGLQQQAGQQQPVVQQQQAELVLQQQQVLMGKNYYPIFWEKRFFSDPYSQHSDPDPCELELSN
jgi:hypothetical protein